MTPAETGARRGELRKGIRPMQRASPMGSERRRSELRPGNPGCQATSPPDPIPDLTKPAR